MTPQMANSYDQIYTSWGKTLTGKTQGGQNAALREKTIDFFPDLHANSVPFRPGISSSRMPRMLSGEPRLRKLVVREVEGAESDISKAREAGTSGFKEARNAKKGKSAQRRCRELVKLSVVGDKPHEERSTL
ncbi:hypothetical protein QL093DRAFT_2087907 [Fusarium oxysporum]|nr:hypothetical protein QL093DRAFT_2087907 [Fusarium oxysporum]